MNDIIIRKAVQEDCAPMLDLIRELADYEKALHEVTLTLEQFTEDGFGKSAVWGHLWQNVMVKFLEYHYITTDIQHGREEDYFLKILW